MGREKRETIIHCNQVLEGEKRREKKEKD